MCPHRGWSGGGNTDNTRSREGENQTNMLIIMIQCELDLSSSFFRVSGGEKCTYICICMNENSRKLG